MRFWLALAVAQQVVAVAALGPQQHLWHPVGISGILVSYNVIFLNLTLNTLLKK